MAPRSTFANTMQDDAQFIGARRKAPCAAQQQSPNRRTVDMPVDICGAVDEFACSRPPPNTVRRDLGSQAQKPAKRLRNAGCGESRLAARRERARNR